MKSNSAKKPTTALPTTLSELVKRIEAALKNVGRFKVVRPAGTPAPSLKSVKFVEVICLDGATDASVILEATFEGHAAPHEVSLPKEMLTELGVQFVVMGFGASPYASGIVKKGMSVHVCMDALSGKLAREIKAANARQNRLDAPPTRAELQEVKKSKRYQRLASLHEKLAAEADALANQRAEILSRMRSVSARQSNLTRNARVVKLGTPKQVLSVQ